MNCLQDALDLAAQGFYVFPLQVNGKTPHIDDFPNQASRDPERIKKWWIDPVMGTEQPYNIGINTTRFNENESLFVVDVDNKGTKKGSEQLLKLELEGKYFPDTATQITPTGGLHLIYRTKEPLKQGVNVLGPGLDTRAMGGYIVAEGSIIDGKRYERKPGNSKVEICPDWIVSSCGRAIDKEKIEVDVSRINQDAAQKRAIYYLENQAPLSIKGQGGDQAAYKVAARLKDFGVQPTACLELMLNHWNDRCPPGWKPEKLKLKIDHAFRYGQETAGSKAPESEFAAVAAEIGAEETLSAEGDRKELPSRFRIESFQDIKYVPSSNHLVKGLLHKNGLAEIVGPSNVGKTTFALDLSMRIALGLPLNGRKVSQGAVVYASLEGRGGFSKKLIAIRDHFNIDPAAEVPFGLISQSIDMRSSDSDVNALVADIKAYADRIGQPIALVVIDTLARAIAGGDENSFQDMSAFVGKVDKIREALGSAVLIVHHTGKNEQRGARGHSSLRAAVDTEIHIQAGRAVVEKQRDLETGLVIPFRLQAVVIGKDEEGDDVTSCVVKYDRASEDFQAAPQMLVPGSQAAQAYETLIAAGGTNGKQIHVTAEWRKALFSGSFSKMKPSTRSQAFKRARDELLNLGLTKESGSLVTATSQVHMTSHVNLSESPSSSHVHNPIGV